jgi:hypothetical protein
MNTPALDQTSDTDHQDQAAPVETIALDQVSGGWMPLPCVRPYPGPCANPYPSPYANAWAAARFANRLEHRAAWMDRRAARMTYWGY